jgi:hypothetical protein
MTLNEYMIILNKVAEEHPEALDMEVITSKDDEGNGFNAVHYGPTLGYFDGSYFTASHSVRPNEHEPNRVCLN